MSQLLQIENTICSKCGRIPRIHLNKDQPGSISLHCNCGNTQTTSITEYLFDVSACPLPPIFDNESEPNKVDVDAILTAIAQGHDHIDNYLVEVKNNVISTLTEIRQNIEKAFNDCVNSNNCSREISPPPTPPLGSMGGGGGWGGWYQSPNSPHPPPPPLTKMELM